eukprot:11171578-Lingulodinium_polyedra.AAC.1
MMTDDAERRRGGIYFPFMLMLLGTDGHDDDGGADGGDDYDGHGISDDDDADADAEENVRGAWRAPSCIAPAHGATLKGAV